MGSVTRAKARDYIWDQLGSMFSLNVVAGFSPLWASSFGFDQPDLGGEVNRVGRHQLAL